jgi:hypothetical protein
MPIMSDKSRVKLSLPLVAADYEAVVGNPFGHFYCPILLEDIPGELCMGHVINKSFANSSRKRVVQRKDVDGFFGLS